MYPATQTFWLEPTGTVATGLRRYSRGDGGLTCAEGHHSALNYIGTAPDARDEQGFSVTAPEMDHDDPRWPTTCQHCDYPFTDTDQWQPWTLPLYRRTDTGQLRVLHASAPAPDAPSAEPGACWDAWWLRILYKDRPSADGITLMVRCPNGSDWCVDSQASNCTRPGEPHQCWVRHGDPRECQVTVDKNGDTCAAGAGSIVSGDYHGFLQHGVLTAG